MSATCEARSASGQRERRSYVKRCLAVMVACVLVFMLLPSPRAQAVAPAAVGMALGGGAAAAPAAAIAGGILLALAGVDFVNGMRQADTKTIYGSVVYDAGYAFSQTIGKASASVQAWWNDLTARIEANPGIIDQINGPLLGYEVPAEAMEYARQWAVQNYDFTEGAVLVTQKGIFASNDRFFMFTSPVPSSETKVTYLGDIVFFYDTLTFPNGMYLGTDAVPGVDSACITGLFDESGTKLISIGHSSYMPYDLGLGVDVNGNISVLIVRCVSIGPPYYTFALGRPMPPAYFGLTDIAALNSYVSKAPTLSEPITEGVVIDRLPAAVGYEHVDAYEIPIWDTLTGEGIRAGEVVEPTTAPQPTVVPTAVPGEMVGDIALEDVAAAQESLGAVFTSKFPFSIPWDLARAVNLLAAPAEVPRWELDFLEPVGYRVGGWKGNTTVVIDMGAYPIVGQVCRWTSTVMFCLALIGATKRLIWTA